MKTFCLLQTLLPLGILRQPSRRPKWRVNVRMGLLVSWSLLTFLGLESTVAFAATKPASISNGAAGRAARAAAPTSSSPAGLCAYVGFVAGFSESTNLVTAVAVAMAESNCNPSAPNVNGPSPGCPNGSVDRG